LDSWDLQGNQISFSEGSGERNQANLHKKIVENIVSGSIIITDGWRGYWGVGNNGCIHLSVNHSYYFLDPVNREIHTQHVERVCRSLKESIPKGIHKSYLVDYMYTFVYKRDLPTPQLLFRFDSFVNTIKEYWVNHDNWFVFTFCFYLILVFLYNFF
jgi:hypothetical protein